MRKLQKGLFFCTMPTKMIYRHNKYSNVTSLTVNMDEFISREKSFFLTTWTHYSLRNVWYLMNIYELKWYKNLFKVHTFCTWTPENVFSCVSHRQKSIPWLDSSCKSCLIRVYFNCKRCNKMTLGYNELI